MPSAVFANTVSPTNPPSSPLKRPCSLIKGDKRRRAMGRGGETTMPLHPRPLSTLKCDESRLKTHCSEGSSSSALSALVTAGGSRSCDQSDPGAGASRWRRQPCRCSGSSGFRCLVCTRAPAAVPPFAWIMQSTPSNQFVKSESNHSGTEQPLGSGRDSVCVRSRSSRERAARQGVAHTPRRPQWSTQNDGSGYACHSVSCTGTG